MVSENGVIVQEYTRNVRFLIPICPGGPTIAKLEFEKTPGKLPKGGGPDYWYHIHIAGIYWGSITSLDTVNIDEAIITHSLCTQGKVTEKIVEVIREVFSNDTPRVGR